MTYRRRSFIPFLVIFTLQILATASSGQSWKRIVTPEGYGDFWPVSERCIFTIGSRIMRTLDSGATWTERQRPQNFAPGWESRSIGWYFIRFTSESSGYADGRAGAFENGRYFSAGAHTGDSAGTWYVSLSTNSVGYWETRYIALVDHFYDITNYGPGSYIRDSDGTVVVQGGRFWYVRSIDFDGDFGMLISGDRISTSTDHGKTWITTGDTIKSKSPAVVSHAGNGDWFVARDNMLMDSKDSGRTWRSRTILDSSIDLKFDRKGRGYILLADGYGMLYSSDFGESWTLNSLPEQARTPIVLVDTLHAYLPTNTNVILRSTIGASRIAPILRFTHSVNFDTALIGDSVSRSIILTNPTDSAVVISSVELNDAQFHYSLSTMSVLPHDTVRLVLTFLPNKVGKDTAFVLLHTNTDGGIERVRLIGRGSRIVPMLRFNTSVNLGSVFIGDSSSTSIPLISLTDSAVVISSVEVNNAHFRCSLSSMTVLPHDTARLAVTFAPDSVGPDTAYVLLHTNTEAGIEQVKLIGKGKALPLNTTSTGLHAAKPSLYPMPWTDRATLALADPGAMKRVRLMDVLGNTIWTRETTEAAMPLQRGREPSGMYLLGIESDHHPTIYLRILVR